MISEENQESKNLKEKMKIASILTRFSIDLFHEAVSGKISSFPEMQEFACEWAANLPDQEESRAS